MSESIMKSSSKTLTGRPMVKKGHPWYPIKKEEVKLNTGTKSGPTLVLTSGHLILTPINLINPISEYGVSAKHDYIKEKSSFHGGNVFPQWDDTAAGNAKVGDFFFFCHNQVSQGRDLAEMFKVTEKLDASFRPEHWLIERHKDREVLVLSRYMGYTSVTDIMVATGSRPSRTEGVNCLRGTVRRKIKNELRITREAVE